MTFVVGEMASALTSTAPALAATQAKAGPRLPAPRSLAPAAAMARAPVARKAIVAQAVPVEVAQVAGEAGFIAGTSAVMFGITLVGLAFGFILLRVESLVEDGKIEL